MKTKLASLEPWKLIFPLMLLLCFLKSNAQCSPDVLILLTQADVDNFGATYPSVTDWDGSIQVGDYNTTSNITNLDPFSNLVSICGSLTISYNPILPNLNGLENITNLGNLSIFGNPLLTNLEGLNNLYTIDDSLVIDYNNMLVNLQGLGNLNSVNTLYLSDNNALVNLNGLGNLDVINNLTIWQNPAITSLSGLNIQNSYLENLVLDDNPVLIDIDALQTLTSINNIEVGGNNSLNNLDGFSNLESVEEQFTLAVCPNISNVDALQNLATVGVLYISEMNISNLYGLVNLQTADELVLYSCYQIENLTGLENLVSLKSIQLNDCTLLNSIEALENAVFLEDPTSNNHVYITSNPLLVQCSIAPICDKITYPDFDFYIVGNAVGCESFQAVIDACNLGTAELNFNSIKIYPNPSNSVVNISGRHFLQVKIFDMMGRIVMDVQIENNSFNVEKLAAGNYLAKLIGESGEFVVEDLIVE